MNNRQARKILTANWSKKFSRKVDKLYSAHGNYCMPSVAQYYRIKRAWILVHRKINKYKDKFKKL